MRIVCEDMLVAFAKHKINRGIRIVLPDFTDERSSQHYITKKGRLNNKKALHLMAKVLQESINPVLTLSRQNP